MKNKGARKLVSTEDRDALLQTLKARFEKNRARYPAVRALTDDAGRLLRQFGWHC